jgi:serine/threonine-protein kinase RsbW
MCEPMGRLELAAGMESLAPLLEFARERVLERGFDEGTADRIELALEEVLVNIINYAYPEEAGNIELRFAAEDEYGLVIEVGDRGIPFDPLAAPEADTAASLEERNIGGLGIFFVRRIMDRVKYRREEGRNILTLAVGPKPGVAG